MNTAAWIVSGLLAASYLMAGALKTTQPPEKLRPQMQSNGTRILRGPHLTAFLEDWLSGRSRKVAADSVPDDTMTPSKAA